MADERSMREELEDAITEHDEAPDSAPLATVVGNQSQHEGTPAGGGEPDATAQVAAPPAEGVLAGENEKGLLPDKVEGLGGKVAAPTDPAALQPKAPAGWKPEARELWTKLDSTVQAEVTRRERQISEELRTTGAARELARTVEQIARPYEATMRANNTNPLAVFENMLKAEHQLMTLPPAQKAALVENWIRFYGVDVDLLDQAIVAQRNGQPQGGGVPAELQTRLAPIEQFVHSQQAAGQQAVEAAARQTAAQLEEFTAKNEFIDDVREDMADLMEIAMRRGRQITLQQAYDQATMAHPTISKILEQRKSRIAVATQNEAAQQARRRSKSISGSPAGEATAPVPGSLRAQLEASWTQTEGRV